MNRRAVTFLMPNEPLVCPHGHKFPRDFWIVGSEPGGGCRCKHKPPPRGVECGLLVYWVLFPGGTRLVVEVSSRELRDMEDRRMNVEQVREYLGLSWPARGAA